MLPILRPDAMPEQKQQHHSQKAVKGEIVTGATDWVLHAAAGMGLTSAFAA